MLIHITTETYMGGIKMKNKRIIGLILAATTLLTVGCASSASSKSGTYKGSAEGYNGSLNVEVEVAEGKVTNITLLENGESSPVIKRAFPVISERIIEAQTSEVDSVSGATFSSYAVKKAVSDAVAEAGLKFGDITFTTSAPEVEKKALEEVKTQLVVVGGGPAGLSAAIEAKQNGVDDIILVEKLDILSGNGKFDMNFFDMINSQAQIANGKETTIEEFVEGKKGSAWDTEERLYAQAEGANTVDAWLRDMGIELNYNYGATGHMAEADAYAGEEVQDGLEAKVKELGIDVRTGTKGLDLIIEDGKAVGVKVENREGSYDIKADAVIVATGGFSYNKELLAEYAPGAEKIATSNQMGATGDFVEVFKNHDIALDHMDKLSIFKTIITGRRDLTGAGNGFIFVNKDGERFIDETKGGMDTANAIVEEGDTFYIYDQTLFDSAYRLKKHNDLGYHVKADTLEELAEKLGINAENLEKTVDTFNQAARGEIADPVREKANENEFNMAGPFYGVQVESAIHMTKGGVVADEKAQVINNSGEVVDGLYAAGEVADTSGAYSASVIFGRISGEEAAKFILE